MWEFIEVSYDCNAYCISFIVAMPKIVPAIVSQLCRVNSSTTHRKQSLRLLSGTGGPGNCSSPLGTIM